MKYFILLFLIVSELSAVRITKYTGHTNSCFKQSISVQKSFCTGFSHKNLDVNKSASAVMKCLKTPEDRQQFKGILDLKRQEISLNVRQYAFLSPLGMYIRDCFVAGALRAVGKKSVADAYAQFCDENTRYACTELESHKENGFSPNNFFVHGHADYAGNLIAEKIIKELDLIDNEQNK